MNVGVNNFPKVVTRQRRRRELNSQPSSGKSNALTTRLPSHTNTTLHHVPITKICTQEPCTHFPALGTELPCHQSLQFVYVVRTRLEPAVEVGRKQSTRHQEVSYT